MAFELTRIITTRHHRSGMNQEKRIELPRAHSFALPDDFHQVSDRLHVKYEADDGKDVIDAWHVSKH